MDIAKPENVERALKSPQQETQKAEASLRKVERANIEHVKIIHLKPTDKEIKLKDIEANKIYEKNGYKFTVDKQRNPTEVGGNLHLTEKPHRSKLQGEIGKLGEKGDEGGHIIGAQFDGPTDAFNIRPENAHLNRSGWKKIENKWVKALEAHKKVRVEIKLHYKGDTIRPDTYIVQSWVNGEPAIGGTFRNQA